MFKRHMIQDERIINLQNKIFREIYVLVMVICIGSMVLKIVSGRGGFEHLGTEMIILFFGALYYLVRSANMGIFSEEVRYARGREVKDPEARMAMKGLGMGVATGIVLGIFFGFNSALNYADDTGKAIFYFLLTFVTTIMLYTPFLFIILFVPNIIAMKKSERVNKKCLKSGKNEQ